MSVIDLIVYLFEIINPYSVLKQDQDIILKYKTDLYSEDPKHLKETKVFIDAIEDYHLIATEVLSLTSYVKSAKIHQNGLKCWKFINRSRHTNTLRHTLFVPKRMFSLVLMINY